MRVVAIAKGHDGEHMREPGEEFDIPDARANDGSTWFVPIENKPTVIHKEREWGLDPSGRALGAGPEGRDGIAGFTTT